MYITALTHYILFYIVSYCFLLLAGPPLAPWRLALLFIYDTSFHLLLLFIPQRSYLAYLHYGTVTVCGISNCAPSRPFLFLIHCLYSPSPYLHLPSIFATWRDRQS